MRYSWLDLVLYLFAIVLLIPLVMRLVESVMIALADTNLGDCDLVRLRYVYNARFPEPAVATKATP